MYLPIPYKITYDTHKFRFKSIITKMMDIDCTDLEFLHTIQNYDLLTREKDQSTIWHKRYYDKFENDFLPTYLELVKELRDSFGYDEVVYQSIPTFRVQLGNGNLGVGEWHKDKTYNHGTTEVNFWMPFTDTNEYNTIWMESKEDKGDYKPYTLKYGEILVFSGANLMHGNKNNITNNSRVSVDFRLVDPNKFIPTNAGSINMNAKFDIGGYFQKV